MKFRKPLLGVGALLFAIIAGTVLWKSDTLLGKAREFRADGLLEKSRDAANSGDWQSSLNLSLAAWQLNPGNVETLRQVFAGSARAGSLLYLKSAEALGAHPSATFSDRLEVAHRFLAAGDSIRFQNHFVTFSEEELNRPEALALAIQFSLIRNDNLRALGLVRNLLEARNSMEDQLLAAEVYLRIPTEGSKSQEAALEIIGRLFSAESPSSIALSALRLLQQVPDSLLSPGLLANARETLDLIADSGGHPPAEAYLIAAELELLAPNADHEEIILETIHKFKEEDPVAVAKWLIEIQHPEKIDLFVTPDMARQHGDLADLRIQSLILQERWTEASEMLADPHPDLAPHRVYGLEALIAEREGKLSASAAKWERAIENAGLQRGRESLIDLAKFSSQVGNEEIRNRALTKALKRPSLIGLPASDVDFLFSALAKSNQTEDLLTVSRSMLHADPENPTLINNVVWLELMKEAFPSPENLARLDQLIERFPGMHTLRTTRAIAFLEEGRTDEAVALLGSLLETPSVLEGLGASDKATLALALHQSSRLEEAREIEQTIETETLLASEFDYFRSRRLFSEEN